MPYINRTRILARLWGSMVWCLLASSLTLSGCTSSKVIADAIVTGCGTSTLYLNEFNSRVPASSVTYDPMGGYLFAYWIDDANNVCHGNPGVNGQPGKAVIKAYSPQARDLAVNNSTVTPNQLKAFQEVVVSFNTYVGNGLHFVQTYINLIRYRDTGQAVKVSGLDGDVSIPNVVNIGDNACLIPILLRTNGFPSPVPLPNPAGPNQNTQDPNMCKVRVMPSSLAMTEQERVSFDPDTFQHGTEIFEVP